VPLGYAELERFYEGLVTRAREQGITCAITSGMACVAFGVAQTTRDCDVLCVPEAAERARIEQAERLLAQNPLLDYGLERMLAEARELTARFVPPRSLEWLPDARKSFIGLGP